MTPYTRYIISTLMYGICVLFGIFSALFFAFQQQWVLVVLGVIFVYVALDNFFCGSRACRAGIAKPRTQYILPLFLKKKKRKA